MSLINQETPHAFLKKILTATIIIFAIVGIFATVNFFDNMNKQWLIESENSITTNVTVAAILPYNMGFIDVDGKGYVVDRVFSFSKMDSAIVGHTYRIKYFCNILDNNERTIMEMVDFYQSPYTCIEKDGVCQ